MAKFKVFYNIPTFYSIDIEAETEEAAIKEFNDGQFSQSEANYYPGSVGPELDCVEEYPND